MSFHVIHNELNQARQVLNKFLSDDKQIQAIDKAATLIVNVFKMGGKMIACGNGGSHCDAMHFSEELTCRYRESRIGYPAIAISDPSYLSCVSNDFGYDKVFSRYIEAVGKKEDIFVGISTSGSSDNIIIAANAANKKGMKVLLLTGKNGSKMEESVDVEICVSHIGYADRIQEMHIKIIHIIILLIEKKMLVS